MALLDIYRITYFFDKGSHPGDEESTYIAVTAGTKPDTGFSTAQSGNIKTRPSGTAKIKHVVRVLNDVWQ